MDSSRLSILSGNAHKGFAQMIAAHLGVKLADAEVKRFSNEEIGVNVKESLRDKDVYIIQPTFPNPNDSLMELLILADAARRASATRITAVIPYFGYCRQDKKEASRTPISAKLIANMIQVAGINRVMTMDLHSDQVGGFFDIPVDNFYAEGYLARYLQTKIQDNVVVISPGIAGVSRAKRFADQIGAPLAIVHFGKVLPGEVKDEIPVSLADMKIVGDVRGLVAILFEDMVDTCNQLVLMTQALLQSGAKKVIAMATHGILSGPGIDRVNESLVDEVIVTNTVMTSDKQKLCKKLIVIDITDRIANGIHLLYKGITLSNILVEPVTELKLLPT